jgi:hypothetical protein
VTDQFCKDQIFDTPAMVEILLNQKLIDEAREMVDRLNRSDPENPRVVALSIRLEELESQRSAEQLALPAIGKDTVSIAIADRRVRVSFEITDAGIALAKRKVRYSGYNVLRIFTAAPGPRGVRISSRDEEIQYPAGRFELPGMPRPAVHVAAVGFLAHTGEFVPLAQSEPLSVDA